MLLESCHSSLVGGAYGREACISTRSVQWARFVLRKVKNGEVLLVFVGPEFERAAILAAQNDEMVSDGLPTCCGTARLRAGPTSIVFKRAKCRAPSRHRGQQA